jgi:chorismate lyase / 3-hydroxybenzoate synthase
MDSMTAPPDGLPRFRSPPYAPCQVNLPMSICAAGFPPLRIALGANQAGVIDAGLPVLAGEPVEDLFGSASPAGRMGAFTLFRTERWLLGAATVSLSGGLEEASYRLYCDIFHASLGRHLVRIWNYVPAINEPGPAGLENYRVFCRGRSFAFEQQYGSGFKAILPSASAVGSQPAALTVVFAASTVQPRHVENPLQIPAYDYPGEYGPRPPSFSRATLVPGLGRATVFISGTAAIRGHTAVAPHNTREQLECTLENLREISSACGLGPDLDRRGGSTRHFKVYLRRAADLPLTVATLDERLLASTDRVSYLQADMCRAALLVEIEASLFGVTGLRG